MLSVALNIVIAATMGILTAVSVANYRTRKLAGTATVGSVALALATFTCPCCAVPVAATLGVVVMGTTLPYSDLFRFVTSCYSGTIASHGRRMIIPECPKPTTESLSTRTTVLTA